MGNRIQKCETNSDKKGIELPLVGEIDLIGIRLYPKRGKIFANVGNIVPMSGQKNTTSCHKQTGSIWGAEIELFDLIKKRFVADLQDFGCSFSIPVGLLEHFTDKLTFRFKDGFPFDLF
jgi:hypothetical protein